MPMADEKLMVAMTPQDLLEMNIFQKKKVPHFYPRLLATLWVARPRYRSGHLTRAIRLTSFAQIPPSAELRIARKHPPNFATLTHTKK